MDPLLTKAQEQMSIEKTWGTVESKVLDQARRQDRYSLKHPMVDCMAQV